MASVSTLEDLFRDGLRDIYYAEKQIVRALGQMAKKTKSDELKEAFETHREESETQVERLEKVFQMMGEKPRAKKCAGIEGILAEGKEHMEEIEDEDVGAAAMIADAQSVEHYEISRYGTLVAWAQQLGNDKAAELLTETLEEEKRTDRLLTELAESMVNEQASEEADGEAEIEEEKERTS